MKMKSQPRRRFHVKKDHLLFKVQRCNIKYLKVLLMSNLNIIVIEKMNQMYPKKLKSMYIVREDTITAITASIIRNVHFGN